MRCFDSRLVLGLEALLEETDGRLKGERAMLKGDIGGRTGVGSCWYIGAGVVSCWYVGAGVVAEGGLWGQGADCSA